MMPDLPFPCTVARGCDCPEAHVTAGQWIGGEAARNLVEGSEWDGEALHAVGYVAHEIDAMFKYPERYPNQMPNIRWALERLWAVAYEKGRSSTT